MADQHELKQLYEGIEADEVEMARYRNRMAAKLQQAKPKPTPLRWFWLGAPLLAGLAAFFLISTPRAEMDQQSLEQLRFTVAASADPQQLKARAESLRLHGNELIRLNANMILCLTQPNGEALELAAKGAIEDPRPEFRAFYVEYLLDHANGYQLSLEKVELAIDSEADPLCLELYGDLLKMAKRTPEVTPKA